ncbi:peroxiredoxin [Symbioplanes lichenis]|uniref:peroxiredoxin n=1 Tax=Symbioplanes lichenis TaxID=1629072 RepID=UPI002739BD07|nr:peroxiredoxin [Actinoplanes lichenis]
MTIDVGSRAPGFTLKDQNNQEVALADFRARKAVLLVFYPLAFTGTCQGELTELQANLPEYANDRLQVLTISVDSVYSHKVWADREGYTFPLLSDFWPHGAVAQSYGIFNDQAGFADRGTFLIDTEGLVRFAQHEPPGHPRNQSTWRDTIKTLLP